MNKRELDILEKCFAAEIDGAITKGIGLYQTSSKLTNRLEADGYIVKETRILEGRPPVTIEGYRLTVLGNLTYCMSC